MIEVRSNVASTRHFWENLSKAASRNERRCGACREVLRASEGLRRLGRFWHKECFHCASCKQKLTLKAFTEVNHKVYCSECFRKQSDEPQPEIVPKPAVLSWKLKSCSISDKPEPVVSKTAPSARSQSIPVQTGRATSPWPSKKVEVRDTQATRVEFRPPDHVREAFAAAYAAAGGITSRRPEPQARQSISGPSGASVEELSDTKTTTPHKATPVKPAVLSTPEPATDLSAKLEIRRKNRCSYHGPPSSSEFISKRPTAARRKSLSAMRDGVTEDSKPWDRDLVASQLTKIQLKRNSDAEEARSTFGVRVLPQIPQLGRQMSAPSTTSDSTPEMTCEMHPKQKSVHFQAHLP